MSYGNPGSIRRTFTWSQEAKQLVADHRQQLWRTGQGRETDRQQLVSKLVEVSGNPRDACLRFLRRLGVAKKRSYREWTTREQQHLVELIEDVPVEQVARILRRPPASVRSMLHRLGLGPRKSREWFTVSLLAQVLHIGRSEVRKWIDRGWLKSRVVQAQSVRLQIIEPDDFFSFIKQHGRDVVGRRLSSEGLSFVRDYVFPRPHADLLSVRGPYKKEAKNAVQTADTSISERDELEDDISDHIA